MAEFDYKTFFREIEDGLTIYAHNIGKIIYDAPNTHNKILKRWTIENHTLHNLELEKSRIFAERFHYYRYEYEINITANDVAKYYVAKDEAYIEILKKCNKQELLVATIDKWMKKSDKIGFEIKNAVEVLKYLDGS